MKSWIVLFCLTVPLGASAQDTVRVHNGDVIRMRVAGASTGVRVDVDSIVGDTLFYRECGPCASKRLSRSDVQSMDLRMHSPRSVGRTLRAALVGALATAAAWVAFAGIEVQRPHVDHSEDAFLIAAGAVLFGGAGAVIGIIGDVLAPGEEWKPATFGGSSSMHR